MRSLSAANRFWQRLSATHPLLSILRPKSNIYGILKIEGRLPGSGSSGTQEHSNSTGPAQASSGSSASSPLNSFPSRSGKQSSNSQSLEITLRRKTNILPSRPKSQGELPNVAEPTVPRKVNPSASRSAAPSVRSASQPIRVLKGEAPTQKLQSASVCFQTPDVTPKSPYNGASTKERHKRTTLSQGGSTRGGKSRSFRYRPPSSVIYEPPPPTPPSKTANKNHHRQEGSRKTSNVFEPSMELLCAAAAAAAASGSIFGVGGMPANSRLPLGHPRLTTSLLLPFSSLFGLQLRHFSDNASALRREAEPAWLQREGTSVFELFEKAVRSPRPAFRFLHAASAMPKKPSKKDIPTSEEYLSVQVGEDSYFVRTDSLGVADGVGGWAQYKGANPALYSRKIMHYASAELDKLDDYMCTEYDPEDYNDIDPRDILRKSFDQTTKDAEAEKLVGSTTAMIAILREDELRIANLGDCGIMIIRNSEPIFRTEEQQHSFNFPYQLGTGSRDRPSDAQLFKVKVEEGDIVILGSDGMFDNVFDEDIVDIVRKIIGGKNPTKIDPKGITDALLRRAREIAEDGRFTSSPFQSRAIREGLYYQGGKLDDVTVLAGVVRLSEDSPDRR